jgi:hypothetical protein
VTETYNSNSLAGYVRSVIKEATPEDLDTMPLPVPPPEKECAAIRPCLYGWILPVQAGDAPGHARNDSRSYAAQKVIKAR